MSLVCVENLRRFFPVTGEFHKRLFGGTKSFVHAVDDVAFDIKSGEVFGPAGESGCGKTTLGRLLVRLDDPTEGRIIFDGEDITGIRGRKLKSYRRRSQMIFQDPYRSLNPRLLIQDALLEPLRIHSLGNSSEERIGMVNDILNRVGLKPPEQYLSKYPNQLSGGERQRVAIARALILRPDFVVADEPVSMLDATIRTGIMRLIFNLKRDFKTTYVLVTHDLSVARYICDRLAVMYLGKIVEMGTTEKIVSNPSHPYTQALLAAVPIADLVHKRNRVQIKGEIPSPVNPPKGCRFHTRCPYAAEKCKSTDPEMIEIEKNHVVLCLSAIT